MVISVDGTGPGYRGRMATAVPAPDERAARVRRTVLGVAVLAAALVTAACAGVVSGSDAAGPDTLSRATDAAPTRPTGPAPAPATPAPLVTGTPDAYSEVGQLVAGFPVDLLPLPPDAVILVTSAVPVGDAGVQEVSLNLRTAATTAELVEMYRRTLGSAGFTEVSGQAESDLAAEVTFVRSGGDELVSIGVLDVDGARTLTIGGRVRTSADAG